MNNISLHINGLPVELNDGVQFAVTKQYEDVLNPTKIIADWSKTITIPHTSQNAQIFGDIASLDKIYVEDTDNGSTTGVYFNPREKFTFALRYGDIDVMSGYGKLVTIKREGGTLSYEVNLFGQTANVLSELKKITFADDAQAPYKIAESDYMGALAQSEAKITRMNVAKSWINDNTPTGEITSAPMESIVGFMPTSGALTEGFDGKRVQTRETEIKDFTELLKGSTAFENTGVSPDAIVGDGLVPRAFNEYRSWTLQPYTFIKRLFQLFEIKARQLGIALVLDSDWFSDSNPLYARLVMLLKNVEETKDETTENILLENVAISSASYTSVSQLTTAKSCGMTLPDGVPSEYAQYISNANPITWRLPLNKLITGGGNISIKLSFGNYAGLDASKTYDLDNLNPLLVNVNYWHRFNGELRVARSDGYIVQGKNETPYVTLDGYNTRLNAYEIMPNSAGDRVVAWCNIPVNMDFNETYYQDYCFVTLSYKFLYQSSPLLRDGATLPMQSLTITHETKYVNHASLSVQIRANNYSGSHFSIGRFWDKDKTLLDEILRYCKMFRLQVVVNESNIQIQTPANYFRAGSVQDWTDKVDTTKGVTIAPSAFDKRYLLFNYEDSESELNANYKRLYGFNFGEGRYDTGYKFNDEKEDLFSGCRSVILQKEAVTPWWDVYRGSTAYRADALNCFPNLGDKEKKRVGAFGAYLFRGAMVDGTWTINAPSQLRSIFYSIATPSVKISDDTHLQIANQDFCYIDSSDVNLSALTEVVSTFPLFSISDEDGNLCLLNTPSAVYDGRSISTGKSIYDRFWADYIAERYGKDSKKLTLYVYLTASDYTMFLNHATLVRIGENVFFVNKIDNFDFDPTTPTKVELYNINNLDVYRPQ